jgi:hypothetical protein
MFVNLTPHSLSIFRSAEDTTPIVVPPSGQLARVGYKEISSTVIDGIPVSRSMLTGVQGLPEPAEGVIYLVSGMVLEHLGAWGPARGDVLAPGELVRDADGRPVGCLGLRGS